MSQFSSMGGSFGGGGSAFGGGSYGGSAIGPNQQTMSSIANQMSQAGGFAYQKQLNDQQFNQNAALANQQNAANAGLSNQSNATSRSNAAMAAQAAEYPSMIKQQDFQQLFPSIQSSLSALNTPGNVQKIAGTPGITVGGVYNPQQIQQQVNASNAATNASTSTQNKQQASSLAGRGFGSNSPLAQMLASGNQMNALQTNTANETGIRQNAAQQNASQLLNSQNAYESAQIARDQPYFQQQSALISLLGAFA